MINRGKHSVAGVGIDAVDYEYAVARIIESANQRKALTVSALAVHGVMTGVLDPPHKSRLNTFDLLVPDGQPVRWALRALHGVTLPDRVYGPNLTLRVCEAAAGLGLPVFFMGSRASVLEQLRVRLQSRVPSLNIAGMMPSQFRRLSISERDEQLARIRSSGAAVTFVGLGCPRQEVWCYENAPRLRMPVIAVGAAFDFHAGVVPQAPPYLQRIGLEWLFRLALEPRRLWRRYLLLNPAFVYTVVRQWTGRVPGSVEVQPAEERFG